MAKIYDFMHTLGNPDHYNSINLKEESRDELKREYRRFRNEARARINQLKKYGYDDTDAVKYSKYLDNDPSNMTKRELIENLIRAESFVTSDQSTIQGQINREENLKSKLQDLGYEHITQKTAKGLNEFFKETRHLINAKIIGSPDVLEMYDKAIENNLNLNDVAKNFMWYYERIDEIDELELNTIRKRAYTKTQLEKIFDRR